MTKATDDDLGFTREDLMRYSKSGLVDLYMVQARQLRHLLKICAASLDSDAATQKRGTSD